MRYPASHSLGLNTAACPPLFLHMIVRPHLHWFRLLFVWRGSVLPLLTVRLACVLAVSVASVLCRDWWLSAHAASARLTRVVAM